MTSARAVLVLGAIVYLALSLDRLTVFPAVGEDEPWIASAPYKLASKGVYGSDLFAGYYGVDRHNYQQLPLYPLLQAAVFKIAGVGVFQMRLLPVLFGLALLVAVFRVGTELADARVGALAVVLLLGFRLTALDDATGNLFLDRARINRYDIAVPVFGLLALWTFIRAERAATPEWWYSLAGVLTGLSSLSHLFGGFWLPILLALLWVRPNPIGSVRAASFVLLSFVVAWLPCVAFIASGWEDYLGQMRFVAARFDVFNLSFYYANVFDGRGPISLDWLRQTIRTLPWNRAGAWTALAGLPIALGVMVWRGLVVRDQPTAWILGAAGLAQFLMFLVLLTVKAVSYTVAIWPLGVLMLAWLGVWVWDRRRAWLRAAVVAVVALVLVEGGVRIAHARTVARQMDSYDAYTAEIARCIPAGSLVLGLQHYWLGLRQYPYRTWLMATNLAHPLYYHDPLPLDVALDRIDPDIILVDKFMANFFRNAARPDNPLHYMQTGFEAFLARRRAEAACTVENRTYGTMIVYRVPK